MSYQTPLILVTLLILLLSNGNTSLCANDSFIHQASPLNTSRYSSLLSHPTINNNPNAMLFVTPHCKGCQQSLAPLGVNYNGRKWSIFRQDLQAIPKGQRFNIFIEEQANPNVFIHTIDASNTNKHLTILEHPLLDNHPEALLFTTIQQDEQGIFNNTSVVVYYSTMLAKWCLINASYTPFPPNLKINVLVEPPNAHHVSIAPQNANADQYYAVSNDNYNHSWNNTITLTQTRVLEGPHLIGIRDEEYNSLLCLSKRERLKKATELNILIKKITKRKTK